MCPLKYLRFSVHDVCICGMGMWGWAGHLHESAAVLSVETQTCRSEAHIAKHQCLTSKEPCAPRDNTFRLMDWVKTNEAKQGVSTTHFRFACLFRDLNQAMCLLASVKC